MNKNSDAKLLSTDRAPVITIDGPCGAGKGTLGLRMAEHLNWHYLDSGTLYRAVAYLAQTEQLDTSSAALVQAAKNLNIRFVVNNLKLEIYINEKLVTDFIRSLTCAQLASKIATQADIRRALMTRQKLFCQLPGLIADGRDMGTNVFTSAFLKIFLVASPEERAQRRFIQLKNAGQDINYQQLFAELKERDERDEKRAVAPLKPAEDAIIIDTTKLKPSEVFNLVLSKANHLLQNHSIVISTP